MTAPLDRPSRSPPELPESPFRVAGGLRFLYGGPARAVRLVPSVADMPGPREFGRLPGLDLFRLDLPLPPGARFDYRLRVDPLDGPPVEILDPLNPHRSRDRRGACSVARGPGYVPPAFLVSSPEFPSGAVEELPGEPNVRIWRPSDYDDRRVHALVAVLDGGGFTDRSEFRRAMAHLVGAGRVLPAVAAIVGDPGGDAGELERIALRLPAEVSRRHPISRRPSRRILVGAGAAAATALGVACGKSDEYDALVLLSAEVDGLPRIARRPARRIYVACGLFEAPAAKNRRLVADLRAAGALVRHREAPDGGGVEHWRDRLPEALEFVLPHPRRRPAGAR